MSRTILLLCLVAISLGQINCVLNPKVVCYYENWFHWRTKPAQAMNVEDVDSSLCTDIVYAYMGITNDNQVSIPDTWLMQDLHDLEKFSRGKGHARALFAIGGYSLSSNFASMVSSSSHRSTFIDSAVALLKKYDFDGVTLDWSRPSWDKTDFDNFVLLLKELHSEFNGKYTLGITISTQHSNFAVKDVDSYVDFISVQTFDFHGSWEKEVGYEAPLDWMVKSVTDLFNDGASINKLLVTIPMFAHTWILADADKSLPGDKAVGPGKQGTWTQAEGKLGFNELCTQIKEDPTGWKLHRDTDLASVYAVHGTTWVTFEDTVSSGQISKNVTTVGFGGVVVQALYNDDFSGVCGEKYPLLKAINKNLNKDPITVPTKAPYRTTQRPILTTDPNVICHKEGYVRDPKDCNVYHKCTEFLPNIFTDEKMTCPLKSEAFDEQTLKCIDKSLVPGCH